MTERNRDGREGGRKGSREPAYMLRQSKQERKCNEEWTANVVKCSDIVSS